MLLAVTKIRGQFKAKSSVSHSRDGRRKEGKGKREKKGDTDGDEEGERRGEGEREGRKGGDSEQEHGLGMRREPGRRASQQVGKAADRLRADLNSWPARENASNLLSSFCVPMVTVTATFAVTSCLFPRQDRLQEEKFRPMTK